MNDKLEYSVNHRITTVAGLLKRQISRVISSSNVEITPEQWVILNYLWEKDGLTIGELTVKSKKDFANVTRIVEKLERHDYVTKRKNSKDGRSFLVFITDKALNIKSDIEKCWAHSLGISLKNVGKKEQNTLLNTLQKIENNIISYLDGSEE